MLQTLMKSAAIRALILIVMPTLALFGITSVPSNAAPSIIALHDFAPGGGGVVPANGLVKATDGNYYGTTEAGGAYGAGSTGGGTIYRMTTAGVITVMHSFPGDNSQGWYPVGLMQAADGNLYGVCDRGGTYGYGTVFKMTLAGVTTTLYNFKGGTTDGTYPMSGLMQAADGNLYGVTGHGGASNAGAVFEITTSGTEKLLHSFNPANDGGYAECVLVQAGDGNLYGTTFEGSGTPSVGTIFKVSTTGTFGVVHTFSSSTDGGIALNGLIVASDGNLYGTNGYYGPGGHGTVFKCTTAGVFTVLHSFSGSDGAQPWGSLVQAGDGKLYGTTYYGGTNGDGTVFQITTAGTFASLHSFGNTDGWYPIGALLQGFDGQLYGSATAGQSNGGILFKTTTTGTLTNLHAFTYADPATSVSDLVQGPDGSFYGTSEYGGACGFGSVFKIGRDGTASILHSFNKLDGAQPRAALVFGNDGYLYGTTSANGPADNTGTAWGTAFKISTSGAFTLLHNFHYTSSTEPAQVAAPLIQAADGNFYGVSIYGGANMFGSIFKMTPTGTVTVLHSCANTTADAHYPQSVLVQAADGNFYSTAGNGGANGVGLVYEVTPTGTFSILHSFNTTDGAFPLSALVQGADGKLYGTTEGDSSTTYGTVFSITTTGAFTNLYTFTGAADGGRIATGLSKEINGYFYGRTGIGGQFNGGTLFNITQAGQMTTLASLKVTNDWNSRSGLLASNDGSLYGTTSVGGANGAGQVYRLVFDTNAHNVLVMQNSTTYQGQLWYVWNSAVISTANLDATPASGWKIVGYSDFNGDGYPDILFQNQSTGKLSLWYMNGAHKVSASALSVSPSSIGIRVAGVGSFGSTDGYPDVVLQNTSTGQLYVWHVQNATVGTQTTIAKLPLSGWRAIGVGDFNRDGKSDILFQNSSSRGLAVWLMNGTTWSSGEAFSTIPASLFAYDSVVNVFGQGYPDLVFQSAAGGAPALWDLTGVSITATSTLPMPASGMGLVGPR